MHPKPHRTRNLFSASLALLFFAGFVMATSVYMVGKKGMVAEAAESATNEKALSGNLLHVPMLFAANKGQANKGVEFVSTRGNSSFAFHKDRVDMRLVGADAKRFTIAMNESAAENAVEDKQDISVTNVSLRFLGAKKDVEILGTERSPTTSNYYFGSDKSKWFTDIPSYRKITYKDLYPGIDLVFLERDQAFAYDFILSPGADASNIRIAFDDAERIDVENDGSLKVTTATGEIRFQKLKAFQFLEGQKKEVSASFSVQGKEYGFAVGEYDKSLPLVIDPILYYELSSYWGGTLADVISNVKVSQQGNVYMSGRTVSTDFPVRGSNPQQSTYGGGLFDVIVVGTDPTGSQILFSSYFGGTGDELQFANGTAVDASGNIYLTGRTNSSDFPTMSAYDASYNGGLFDVFLAKFSSGGNLLYSTYLGGTDDDQSTGTVVSSTGEMYVTGSTKSADFPMANALDASYGGSALNDAFVTKFNAAGSALIFSTYYGGAGSESSTGLALDPSGNPVFFGSTTTTGIAHVDPYQGTHGGSSLDGLIVKLAADGSSILYSTYIGGNGSDSVRTLAYDSAGKMVMSLSCGSTDMATLSPYQASIAGGFDNFFAKFNLAGNALEYGTYHGGVGTESPFGMVIDRNDTSYVVGSTASANFPVTNPIMSAYAGGSSDIELVALPSDGLAPIFATYIGGTNTDSSQGIDISATGRMWIGGNTASTDFPLLNAYQGTAGGGGDAAILRLAFENVAGGGGGPAPYVALQVPNGFETYFGGDIVDISWYSQSLENTGTTAKVYLSLDAGKTFQLISANSPFAGPVTWTVPYLNQTTPALIRLEIVDGAGNTVVFDESDYQFTIKQTAAPIVTPVETRYTVFPNGIASGDLVKVENSPTVYYVTSHVQRFSFPTQAVYESWYGADNFVGLKTISMEQLNGLNADGEVTYRPGTRLVKVPGNPKVYTVSVGGVLRHIGSEALATSLYGTNWDAGFLDVISDAYFSEYTIGPAITDASQYDKEVERSKTSTIEVELEARGLIR